jgi:hypothetical protein
MTAWAHLPNAKHIDRILASLKANPEKWNSGWNSTREAAWDAVWGAAWDAVWGAAWDAVWGAVCGAAWNAARGATFHAARDAARGAIAALIAWDDCAYLLESDVDALRIYAALGVPAAILLLPAVIAMEKEIA